MHLHSTMQRLKPSSRNSLQFAVISFTFHYAKIKTFVMGMYSPFKSRFTFHYAKIKTLFANNFKEDFKNLHSTMQRLKRICSDYCHKKRSHLHSTMQRLKHRVQIEPLIPPAIYIPLCKD